MANKPMVTIIIPVYNGRKYVEEAIKSAINQTYENIEIIVINDGSTDNIDDIIKKYENKIRYYKKENGGVSTALNFAISKMNGEYFSWLSHDDRYYPNKIERQIELISQYKNDKVILFSDYDIMNEKSKIIGYSTKNHKEIEEKPEYILLRGNVNGITLLIPKLAFIECGYFEEKLRCTQDYELWNRMMRKYKFIHQSEVLATTRVHSRQQTNTNSLVLEEGNNLWSDLINQVKKERMQELEYTEYNFLYEMDKFLCNTPYDKVREQLKLKMNIIEKQTRKTMDEILVSVIIPFHNRKNMVIDAINSVIKQTHRNFEILLINDGSTENLTELEEFILNEKRIRYIKLEENKGASYARNLGIKSAKGKYIAFLDSDDIWVERKLEEQLFEIYIKGYKFSHTSYIRKQSEVEQKIESGTLTGQVVPHIICNCMIATPTVMLETKYIKENNYLYDENLTIGEDVCFYLNILKNTKVLGINKFLTIVNTNDNSSAYNREKQILGMKTIINYVLSDRDYREYNTEISILCSQFLKKIDNYKEIQSDMKMNIIFEIIIIKVKRFIKRIVRKIRKVVKK